MGFSQITTNVAANEALLTAATAITTVAAELGVSKEYVVSQLIPRAISLFDSTSASPIGLSPPPPLPNMAYTSAVSVGDIGNLQFPSTTPLPASFPTPEKKKSTKLNAYQVCVKHLMSRISKKNRGNPRGKRGAARFGNTMGGVSAYWKKHKDADFGKRCKEIAERINSTGEELSKDIENEFLGLDVPDFEFPENVESTPASSTGAEPPLPNIELPPDEPYNEDSGDGEDSSEPNTVAKSSVDKDINFNF